jgi:hypothetical protein
VVVVACYRFLRFWKFYNGVDAEGKFARRLTAVELKTLAYMQLIMVTYEQQSILSGVVLSLFTSEPVAQLLRYHDDDAAPTPPQEAGEHKRGTGTVICVYIVARDVTGVQMSEEQDSCFANFRF